LAPKRYVPDPRHVRNSLTDLLGQMRAAKRWPWEGSVLSLYRDIVLPRLLSELADAEEAARWREQVEAEVARLDSQEP
jgi:hypothetical protein